MNEIEILERTRRLEELGLAIRSEEIKAIAREIGEFHARGGNRAMRRAAARASQRRKR